MFLSEVACLEVESFIFQIKEKKEKNIKKNWSMTK